MKKAENLMSKIKTEYGVSKYVEVSKDKYFENMSSNLRKLWYSTEEISIASMDRYYNRSLDFSYPNYSNKEFEEDLVSLEEALTQEFALIIERANNWKEEKAYERS